MPRRTATFGSGSATPGKKEPSEHLGPDRKTTDASIIGLQSKAEISLYVNPDTGDDRYAGMRSSRPKRTIQAAWDALPNLIEQDATIYLADGVYYEQVSFLGRSIIGEAVITISGNVGAPDSVRISGAAAATPNVPTPGYGIHVVNQDGLRSEGVQFDTTIEFVDSETPGAGLFVDNRSVVAISDCRFLKNNSGILVSRNSETVIVRVEVDNGAGDYPNGIVSRHGSDVTIRESRVSNMYIGVVAKRLSSAEISRTVSTDNKPGFQASFVSTGAFLLPESSIIGTQPGKCGLGVDAFGNSMVSYANDRVSYRGCDTNTRQETDGVLYH